LRRIPVAASLVVDMTISVLTQAVVSGLAVACLVAAGASNAFTAPLVYGLVILVLMGLVFLMAQHGRALERMARVADRLVSGRLRGLVSHSARFERAIRVLYQRPRIVIACALWQAAAWLAGALEIWVALYFLGQASDPLTALSIELAVQAVSSMAFVVPGAIGVQEGAFVIVGRALGLDASTSLALAAARRLRDLVVFFPGLLLLQWHELRSPARAPHALKR
jgi:putative membrane protein